MTLGSIKSQTFAYSELSRLNTVQVWQNHIDSEDVSTFWIVYIHGGAWRDPAVDSTSIEATLSHLNPIAKHIRGIASLNYRLSPYPNHNGNPSGDDPSRNVKHPQHIEDILTALCWLQNKYSFDEQYILVGHSAGATLAFQSITGDWSSRKSTAEYPLARFVLPTAVAGVAGIYDILTLIESFPTIPAYKEFIESAFGTDIQVWKNASPVYLDLKSRWINAKLAIIAYSEHDELIDTKQSQKMIAQLSKQKSQPRQDVQMEIYGNHDSIWKGGFELAKVIIHSIKSLIESR